MDRMIEGSLNWMNGVACIFWSGFLLASIYRQKIRYGAQLWVIRGESPKVFWTLIAGMAAIVVWTGVAFVLDQAP